MSEPLEACIWSARGKKTAKTEDQRSRNRFPRAFYPTLDLWCGNREYGKEIGSVVKYYKRVKLNEFVHCKNSLGF